MKNVKFFGLSLIVVLAITMFSRQDDDFEEIDTILIQEQETEYRPGNSPLFF